MAVNPNAGQPAQPRDLVSIPRLITAYFSDRPDLSVREQRVSFGTSGHRGSSLRASFNEWHIGFIRLYHLGSAQYTWCRETYRINSKRI